MIHWASSSSPGSARLLPTASWRAHYIDEATHQVGKIWIFSPCDGGPNGNVVSSGVSLEQRLKRSKQPHIERDPLTGAHLLDPVCERLVNREAFDRTEVALNARARAVARQLQQRGRPAKAFPPIANIPFQHFLGEGLLLPAHETGVLQRQFRCFWLLADHKLRVILTNLFE